MCVLESFCRFELRAHVENLHNGGNQKTALEYSLTSRHSRGQEKVFFVGNVRCLAAITENVLVNCFSTAMFCRNFPEVSFEAGNSNSRSGFQTLSINQTFSASVNEALTLYTVPISISEQSVNNHDASLRSSSSRPVHGIAAANKNRIWLVHNYALPMKESFDLCAKNIVA